MKTGFIIFSRFMVRLWLKFYLRIEAAGMEKVPAHGPVIIASNHVTAYDPLIIGTSCKRIFYYMAKRELFENRILRWLLTTYNVIPVDRGGIAVNALRRVLRVLSDGGAVVMFPEGTRARSGHPGTAKIGVGLLAGQAGVPILPAFISGLYGKQLVFGRRAKVRVTVGNAIDPTVLNEPGLDRRSYYSRIAAAVNEALLALRVGEDGGCQCES